MLRLTWKDVVATLLVAAVVVPYVGYVIYGSMPFIQDPEGMAGVGLILGLAAGAIGGWVAWRAGTFVRLATAGLALVSLGLGIATAVSHDLLAATTREALLGAFIASIVALWAVAALRHSGFVESGTEPTSGLGHA
jgi:hypothetical protein